jgi:flavin reductase (DIM6/NTAB) family NADH-FMN oxidoreductase RutF
MTGTAPDEIQHALTLLRSGHYVLTAAHDQKRTGVLVHSAQPCGDAPPLVCVACRKGHPIGPIIRDSHRFGVCQLPASDNSLARRFAFNAAERGDPFDVVELDRLLGACPIIKRSPLAVECEVFRRIDLECECELYIGRVLAARVARAGTE